MIILREDVLVFDHTDGGDDILPILYTGRGVHAGWYIDIGIEDEAVLNRLVDAEMLDDPLPIHYISRAGQAFDGIVHLVELICGPEGNMARLRGTGAPPAPFLADHPKSL